MTLYPARPSSNRKYDSLNSPQICATRSDVFSSERFSIEIERSENKKKKRGIETRVSACRLAYGPS